MPKFEAFNPEDPAYKNVADLPEEHRENFSDLKEGGFVKKSAKETELAAKRLASEKIESGSKEVSEAQDVLEEQAIAEDKARGKVFDLLGAKLSYEDNKDAGKKIEDTFKQYPNLLEDKGFILNLVKADPKFFEKASPKLRNDRDIAFEAVQRDPRQFKFASDRLKEDRDFVLMAASKDELILNQVDQRFKADREIAMVVLSRTQYSNSLEKFPEEIRGDKEIIMSLMRNRDSGGYNLKYASEELRGDKEVVLEALKGSEVNTHWAFKVASEELKKDPEIVLAAIKNGGSSVMGAVPRGSGIFGNMEIAKALVESDRGAMYIRDFSRDIRGSKEFAIFAMKDAIRRKDNNGAMLRSFESSIRNDKEVVLLAVRRDGSDSVNNFEDASDSLRDDEDVLLAAMKSNKNALRYASERLKKKFKGGLFKRPVDVDARIQERALEENERFNSKK